MRPNQKGLNKSLVLMTMGTAAEVDEEDGSWIYLPERYGILIPAESLRLEFTDGVLVDFGYRAIVLGTQLEVRAVPHRRVGFRAHLVLDQPQESGCAPARSTRIVRA